MVNFWKNLPKPFTVLAPMENVTDFVFREIVARELPKPNVMFTEFTNIESLLSKGYEANITKFRFGRTQRPMVAQIWGTNPESFYKVAKMIQELGFDGVDINMGCPVHEVMKIGGGAAMIDNQKLTKEVIEAVKKGANNLPISVKTRIGTKSVTTDKWTTFLLEQKIDALTIHGRTAKQMSKGLADWNEIAKVVKIKNQIAPETIIIGNGDIENYEQVINAHEKYGVDGIMIGRGIFKNPWIFDPTSPRLSMTRKEYIDVLLK
ncbi:MAG TPA: tRNA-dihydrouridine synthase family protein, partial [Alphaproteobacteria bacterium]|nr:tRNA-dihydrouridine synthase family protein [Alphaproteobacteria bacterium]